MKNQNTEGCQGHPDGKYTCIDTATCKAKLLDCAVFTGNLKKIECKLFKSSLLKYIYMSTKAVIEAVSKISLT